ncbi:unnamed protein product [Soboliphyme baturini]|uniref:MHD domain-containing protein n=1 Tax=Soboliphyme baturini TaxID=241478 RepID=A0A183IAS7_9BILA|nr:unnamed protein product [Soboliphyme baturini]
MHPLDCLHFRDITLEKHWKSVLHRSICDYFFESMQQAANPEDVPPILSTPHYYLITIYRFQMYFVAVVAVEAPPLLVIEFLHRVVDTFVDYFEDCTDSIIKENYVTIYELLDEMLDNGFPLATESNILQELIKPSNFFRTLANTVTGKTNLSETLPIGQLSNIPWRRMGVRYTSNEAYFDVIEEIDAIIDKTGTTVFAEIQGYIDCFTKLSGMPDLTLSFTNPRLFDDVSFHPCVRFKRWEVFLCLSMANVNERLLSFIPPDGHFRLMSYHIGSQSLVAIPATVRHSITFKQNQGGSLDVSVGPKQNMGKTLEDVSVDIMLPKCVINCNLVPTQGKYSYDPVTNVLTWEVGKIENVRQPSIRGNITIQGTEPLLDVQFKIPQLTVSGLKVSRLDMYDEKYKPFKGVKYLTKAGKFQVRT